GRLDRTLICRISQLRTELAGLGFGLCRLFRRRHNRDFGRTDLARLHDKSIVPDADPEHYNDEQCESDEPRPARSAALFPVKALIIVAIGLMVILSAGAAARW